MRRFFGSMIVLSILIAVAPAGASAASKVRFLHAVPGGPSAQLEIASGEGEAQLPPASFGEPTEFQRVAPGEAELTLKGDGEDLADTKLELADGASYTVVATKNGEDTSLQAFRSGAAKAGKARWRIVNAAAEVATASVELDGTKYGDVDPASSTPYETTEPGDHRLTLGKTDQGTALISSTENFVAGTSTTAYVVGTGGEPTRFVTVQDAVAAPKYAPATGLEPADDTEPSWIAALLAAIAAAGIGGLAYTRSTSRG